MRARQRMYAVFGVVALLVAGSTLGGATATAQSAAPLIEIVVYDGTRLPGIVAGCSEPDCMGSSSGGTFSGVVTHSTRVLNIKYLFSLFCNDERVILISEFV